MEKRVTQELSDQISEFLDEYPLMSRRPSKTDEIVLEGTFWFKTNLSNREPVEDQYQLKISIPRNFPAKMLSVREIGGRIPIDNDYHIYDNENFCLGSPLRLMIAAYENPTILGFVSECLIPYLCAMTLKLNGEPFIFGELAHGTDGLISDYKDILKLKDKTQVLDAFELLGMKKKVAYKKICPCGCKKRHGTCSYRHILDEIRMMAPLSWFRDAYQQIST